MTKTLRLFLGIALLGSSFASSRLALAQEGEEPTEGTEGGEGGEAATGDGTSEGGDEAWTSAGAAAATGAEAVLSEASTGFLVVAPKGKVVIAGDTVRFSLSNESFEGDPVAFASPISLAPDVWYGFNEKLTLGLTHAVVPGGAPSTGFGGGICLTGEDNGCRDVYEGPAIEGRYLVLSQPKLDIAAHGGLAALFFSDPSAYAIRIGAFVRFQATPEITVDVDPNLQFGLNNRTITIVGQEFDFNGDFLNIPVWVKYRVNEKIVAYGSTGLRGFLEQFGDSWGVALGAGAMYWLDERLGVGGELSFPSLFGSEDSTGNHRELDLRVVYTLL